MTLDNKKSNVNSDDGAVSKSVDFIFKNKKLLLILLILLVGGFLRYLAAVDIEPNADEMVHGPHAKGIIDSGVIGRVWQSILWSYLTDFFYSLGGTTMLMARSLSFIFGALSIILVYLIAKELFDRRTAILASAFLAISSFHIINTLIEMDIAAAFFVLYAALFFIKRLKKDGKFSYIAALLIGVATLIKTLSLFFVPAFILAFFFYHKKIKDKKLIANVIKFCLIIFLVGSPLIIHNYLWYEDKGMVDAYLSQYFDIGKSREVFAGIQGINNGFKFNELVVGSLNMLKSYFLIDPVLLVLGILGLVYFVYRKEKFAFFFLMFQVIPFILITATNRLGTHYAVFPPVFALYAAAFASEIIEKYKNKLSWNKVASVMIIVIVAVNGYIMIPYLNSQTALTDMRDYTITSIDKKDIVIADARIYRGRIMWMFSDRHYLESSFFPNLIALNNNLTAGGARVAPYKVYFVECIVDDCGWGTIKDQPEFNRSSEEIVSFFRANTKEEIVINGGGNPVYYPSKPYFRVYSGVINLNPELVDVIDSTHSFFYYPANYVPKEQIIDNYDVNGPVNSLLYYAAKWIIWTTFLAALASIFTVLYQFYKEEKIV